MSGIPSEWAPIQGAERINALDVTRGFALFGILLVNMAFFYGSFYDSMALAAAPSSTLDQVTALLIRFFAESKFYTLFSFLFGIGFAIQMERAQTRGVSFVPVYARRLLVLLGMGMVHALFVWSGDVLVPYAVFGFILLAFRNRSPRTLLIWSAGLLLVPVLVIGAGTASVELGRTSPEGLAQIEASYAEAEANYQASDLLADEAYRSGSFGDAVGQRVRDLSFSAFAYIVIGPGILAMFLLGLYAWQRGIVQDLRGHQPFLRTLLCWGLVIGLPTNAVYAVGMAVSSRVVPSWTLTLASLAIAVGAPALAFVYASAFALLSLRGEGQPLPAPLAAMGRMALSNYLGQSLICTFIFYGYGLGLYGLISTSGGLLLTIALYLLEGAISVWWIRRFRFGPLEWLWRSLTYQRPPPMRA